MAKLEFYRQQVVPRISTPSGRGLAGVGAQGAQAAEAIARGFTTLGQAVERRNQEVEKAKEDEAAIDASSRAIRIQSRWLEKSQQLEKEAVDKDEIDGYTARAQQEYRKIVDEEAGQVSSERARSWLLKQSESFGLNVQEGSMRWEAGARLTKNANKAEQSFQEGRLIVAAKPQDYERVRDSIALDYAILPKDKGEKAWAQARSSLALDAALAAMSANPNNIKSELKSDPGKSKLSFINDLDKDDRDQLTAQTDAKIEQLRRERERQQALRRQELNERVQNAAALASIGQDPGNIIPQRDFVAAGLTKEDYENYKADYQLFPFMNSIANMPLDQAAAEVEKLRPTSATGAKDAVRRYKTAVQGLNNIAEQRANDPATFMLQNSPLLRQAYEDMTTASTARAGRSGVVAPEEIAASQSRAAKKYAELAKIEAQRLGIQNPRILPNNVAASIVSNTYSDGASILAEKQKWGNSWGLVYPQIANDLPAGAAIASAGMSPENARRLIELSALKKDQLNDLLPSGVSPGEVEDKIRSITEDLDNSWKGLIGAPSTMVKIRGSIYALAADYVKSDGVDGAVEKAYNQVVGERYNFPMFSGSPIRVPVNVRINDATLESSLEIAKYKVQRELGESIVATGSYWQTSEDDDGVILMYNSAPVDLRTDEEKKKRAPERPAFYTWEQLRNMVATREERERLGEFRTLIGRGIK